MHVYKTSTAYCTECLFAPQLSPAVIGRKGISVLFLQFSDSLDATNLPVRVLCSFDRTMYSMIILPCNYEYEMIWVNYAYSSSIVFKKIKRLKLNKALDENSSLSYGASRAILDNTVLPATRHK